MLRTYVISVKDLKSKETESDANNLYENEEQEQQIQQKIPTAPKLSKAQYWSIKDDYNWMTYIDNNQFVPIPIQFFPSVR